MTITLHENWIKHYNKVLDNTCKSNFLFKTKIDDNILKKYYLELNKSGFHVNGISAFEPVKVGKRMQLAYYGEDFDCYGIMLNYVKNPYHIMTAGYFIDDERLLIGTYKKKIEFQVIINKKTPELREFSESGTNNWTLVGSKKWEIEIGLFNDLFDKEERFKLMELSYYLTK